MIAPRKDADEKEVGRMTQEQEEQIWNALHLGKMRSAALYAAHRHIEGAKEHHEAIEREINAAMDVLADAARDG